MSTFEPKQFGKYLLLEKLAVGGMAEIYKAKTYGVDGFEKELAIKRILPHCSADKDFITMLIDEAKLSVVLSHANIVQVYDLGKVGDDYYISMEFIHGPNLRDIMYRCRENKTQIPTDISVYIISEVCKGLDYAHRKTDQHNKPLGIVHRDISPQNILLSYEGEVKIVDFGIAKAAMNISHTMAGILKGKIAYMSPEQAMGKAIDSHTDIFSTGILLFELLSGTKLFTGESQFELLKKIRTTRVTAETLPASIPEPLKAIVAKALAYNEDDRYQNAGDLQIDLTKYLYSTHSDFSPRKLASFIHETFAAEVAHEAEMRAREAAADGQTSSMNIEEGAKQQEIVQREGLGPGPKEITAKTSRERMFAETAVTPAAGAPRGAGAPTESKTLKKGGRGLAKAVAAVLVLGVGIYAAYRYVPAARFWEKPHAPPVEEAAAKFGSTNIVSTPLGAKIFLNDNDTGKITPAAVDGLTVGETYTVRLEKEGFSPAEQTVTIASPKQIGLNITMFEPTGTLNIITEPPGAAIMVNGKLTGLNTPATLEKLPLNTDQRITLSKPDFEDFEQVVNLTSDKPQRISTKLAPLVAQKGKMNITSTPSGATVFVDGGDTGRTTPATIANLGPKKYTVTLKMGGYEDWKGTFDIVANQSIPVDAVLSKVAAEKPAEEPTKEPVAEETKGPEKMGSLQINSAPAGAKIFLGGRATGKATPATIGDLKIGATYKFRMDLDGYKSSHLKKTMTKESETLYAQLTKEEPRQEPLPQATPPPTPGPATPPQPPPQPTEEYGAGSEAGKIRLASNPSGADVFVNAEYRGKTPLTVSVPAGPAHVLVSKEGMSRFSQRITVRPGQTVDLTNISLGDIYGEVSLTSVPARAQVIFDGQNIPAPTPVTVRRVRIDTTHTVTVSLPGYRQWTRSFNMEGRNSASFNIVLEPE